MNAQSAFKLCAWKIAFGALRPAYSRIQQVAPLPRQRSPDSTKSSRQRGLPQRAPDRGGLAVKVQ